MIKKNVFFVLLFLVIIMSSSLKADTLPLLIYDDFTADTINSSLWSIDDPNGVFTQSNGFLKSDSPPNSAFASINSINTFNGDFEFILPYQNFSSTAFLKDKGDTPFPSIRLLAKVNSYPEISVQISRCQEYQGGSGGVFISDEFTDGAITGNDYISSSTSSGNLKIQRIGSTIKTFYKEESQWITLGNYSNAPTDDATIEILASTGFNGLFKVEMDAVYYTDNQISTLYYDSDGDGYGDPSNAIDVESEASGYVTNNLDCDDTNASIHPGAFDHFWDGIDQDCDDTNSDTNLGYGPGQTLDSVSDDNWVYEGRMYDAISTAPLSKSIKVTDKDLRMELFSKDCMDNGILDCERKKRRSQIIEVNKFPMNTNVISQFSIFWEDGEYSTNYQTTQDICIWEIKPYPLCSGTGVCELDTPPTATIKLSSTTGQLIVNTRWCNDSAPNQNNDSCISQQTWVTVGELSRGKWNDFRIETKQSAEADAYIRVYMNSVLIYERIDYPTSYDIPKKFKDSGGYQLMYGPYNCCSDYPELDPNQVFYYDNLMWSITEGSSDTDGDGYTTLEGDCDDTDSSIYPGATEIAGDGIDQDCNGVDETSIGNLIIINPDLSFSIPDALCQALTGDLNLWLDFEFFADPSGKLLWELAASGIATPTGNNINISPDLSFSIPDAKYQSLLGEVDLKTNFIFFGEQSGKLLWELENFNVK